MAEMLRIQIHKTPAARQQVPRPVGSHLGNYAGRIHCRRRRYDIHDGEALEWALCYRVNAAGRITTFAGSSRLDAHPSAASRRIRSNTARPVTRVLIDATINWRWSRRTIGRHRIRRWHDYFAKWRHVKRDERVWIRKFEIFKQRGAAANLL